MSYIVFLHQTTTIDPHIANGILLSYIVFLHQTTTWASGCLSRSYCLISSFYIKPQQTLSRLPWLSHCLISSFYIKPQRFKLKIRPRTIVLYRLSTSNHNHVSHEAVMADIVLYRLSTSNHNYVQYGIQSWFIVLYRLSTSNHNLFILVDDNS